MMARLRSLCFPARPALLAVLPLALAPLAGCAGSSSAGGTATAAPAAHSSPAATVAASGSTSTGPVQQSTAPATPVRATPVTASAAATQPGGQQVDIAEGGDINGTVLYRPACGSGCPLSGDGTTSLWNMTWTAWTTAEAAGTGTEKIDDCNPNCAAGTLHPLAVRVTFSKPVMTCQSGKAAWYWTRVTFTWPDGLPAVFSGDNAPSNPFDYTGITAQAATSCP
jgi:hypothetical protein